MGSISPHAGACSRHLAEGPLSLVLPALGATQEHSFALLESVLVLTFIDVTVGPLSDSFTLGEALDEVSHVEFIFA